MLQGLYSSATGLDAAILNQEVVARNLAHIDVPGFRRSLVSYKTFEAQLQDASESDVLSPNLGTQVNEIQIDFTPGSVRSTGRSLDLALNGDGFFVLDGPDGPLYTRNGVFHLDANGNFINVQGLPVRGASGPILVPNNTSPSSITVTADGTVRVNDVPLGKLKIVKFTDNGQLVPVGTTLFSAGADVTPETSNATVQQGSRELSNVAAIDELVSMIAGLRYYEASQRALRTIAEAVEQNTDPQAG